MYDLVDAFDEDEEREQEEALAQKQTIQPPFADFMESRGIRMRFDLYGPSDGPPLLYIPGATSDMRKEMSQIQMQILARTFCVLTCDLRNQGETEPVSLQDYVPLSTYVDDLIELLDHTFGPNAPVYVVGWSVGAAIALALARLHPKRVKKLAVVQGGYFKPKHSHIGKAETPGQHLFGKDWAWVKDVCSYDSLSVKERCHRMLEHTDIRRREPAHRKKMSPPYKWVHQMYTLSETLTVMGRAQELGRGALIQLTAMFAEGTAKVEEITTPTLIVHGRWDGMHPVTRAEELKDKMPDAQLVILEEFGHVNSVAAGSPAITNFFINSHLDLSAIGQDNKPPTLSDVAQSVRLTKVETTAVRNSARALRPAGGGKIILDTEDGYRKHIKLSVVSKDEGKENTFHTQTVNDALQWLGVQ